jgi:hypothetical protein
MRAVNLAPSKARSSKVGRSAPPCLAHCAAEMYTGKVCMETHDTHGNTFSTRVYTTRGSGIPDRAMGVDAETCAYFVVMHAFPISALVGKRWASAFFFTDAAVCSKLHARRWPALSLSLALSLFLSHSPWPRRSLSPIPLALSIERGLGKRWASHYFFREVCEGATVLTAFILLTDTKRTRRTHKHAHFYLPCER